MVVKTIFHDYQNKNHRTNTSFVSLGLLPIEANKTGFNPRIAVYNVMQKITT